MLRPQTTRHCYGPLVPSNCYLNNDIGLFRRPHELLDALETSSAVLTPHHLHPLPSGSNPDEDVLSRYGTYNVGIIGVSALQEGMNFIDWWGQWLSDPRHLDIHQGFDQIWLNYVPVYCQKTAIIRDPGYNVAFWNLPERELSHNRTSFCVNSSELTAFHFSHFDGLGTEGCLPAVEKCNYPRTMETDPLASYMANLWARHGREECMSWKYGYGSWPDQQIVTNEERKAAMRYWDEIPHESDPWMKDLQFRNNELYPRMHPGPFDRDGTSKTDRRNLIIRILDMTPRRAIHWLQKRRLGS